MSGAATDDLPIDRDEQAADWCVRLGEGVLPPADQAAFDAEVAGTLLRRPSTPQQIGAALRYLIDAEAVTGQMIAADSGQHLA